MIATCAPPPACLIRGVVASTRPVRRWDTLPAWLAPGERTRAAGIRHPRPRNAWLTARLAAKRLVAAHLADTVTGRRADHLATIEIQSRDASGRGCRPRVFSGGREVAVALSIAHVDERVLVAIGPAVRPLGVDLTPAATFAADSSRWWLTAAEGEAAGALGPAAAAEHAARVWTVKEAAYKALLATEPFRPRAIEVRTVGERITECTAAGRSVPATGIRCWRLAGHWLALVQAGPEGGDAET